MEILIADRINKIIGDSYILVIRLLIVFLLFHGKVFPVIIFKNK